ncbi:hypothetical protein B0H12DRAFT_283048 [Mycena haematopus]|nr:hypothetical protein B0H12DRAFT_283048 [Mycena haematopus]
MRPHLQVFARSFQFFSSAFVGFLCDSLRLVLPVPSFLDGYGYIARLQNLSCPSLTSALQGSGSSCNPTNLTCGGFACGSTVVGGTAISVASLSVLGSDD